MKGRSMKGKQLNTGLMDSQKFFAKQTGVKWAAHARAYAHSAPNTRERYEKAITEIEERLRNSSRLNLGELVFGSWLGMGGFWEDRFRDASRFWEPDPHGGLSADARIAVAAACRAFRQEWEMQISAVEFSVEA